MKNLIARIHEVIDALDTTDIAKDASIYMRSITPIKTGNARRNTTSEGNKVIAEYNYFKKLDDGASSQNRIGIIDPTLEHIARYIKKELE